MLDTFAAAYLEKKPFNFELISALQKIPGVPFTTTTFEPLFPYLTSRFGKDVPTDLILKVKKIYDIEALARRNNSANSLNSKGMLKANLDVECEGRLVYPGGLNKSVGYAQWDNATAKVNISQVNGTIFKFVLQSGNTST